MVSTVQLLCSNDFHITTPVYSKLDGYINVLLHTGPGLLEKHLDNTYNADYRKQNINTMHGSAPN